MIEMLRVRPFAPSVLACVIASASACAAEVHVSNRGNDGNPGTQSMPVATLQAAQKIVDLYVEGMVGELPKK